MNVWIIYLIILLSTPVVIFADSDDHDHEYEHEDSHSDMSDNHDSDDEYYDSDPEDDYETYSKHDYHWEDEYDYDDSHGDEYTASLTDHLQEYSAASQSNGLVVCVPGVQFIRHPFRCDQFFQCAHGQALQVVTCPRDLMFNTHLNVCDWPSNVDCDDDDATFSNLYLGDSHSKDWTDQNGDEDEDSSDDDDNDDDDSMDHYDSDDDDYSWDNDDDYHNSYDYMGSRTHHDRSPYQHGYLPIQWHPHPAFGLSGLYHQPPSKSHGTLPSGMYQPSDRFSPILAALFDLQYHHPSYFSNYRYQRGYPQHQQYYHFSPRVGYHYHNDDSFDHDHDYNYYESNDESDDMSDEDDGDNKEEDSYYEDNDYDSHNMHHGNYMEHYQDGGPHNDNMHHSDSDEVAEQSAWLFPFFKYPRRNRVLEPMYHPGQDVQYIHYIHDSGPFHNGRHREHGILGEGESSLLPLLLLKSPEAKQLLMTSTLLSKLKGVTGEGLLKGSGRLGNLMVRHTLLDLLTQSQQQTPPTTPEQNTQDPANLRFDLPTRSYVSLATNQPIQLINPTTSQAVAPANTYVDPLSGQVIETATGQPLGFLEPLTGTIVPGIVLSQQQQQQNGRLPQQPQLPLQPLRPLQQPQLPAQRLALQQPGLLQPRAGQGTLTQGFGRSPLFQGQGLNSANGNDALNLIILSPLTPSSLPPSVRANTGSDALIRGSLREVLGPGLAEVIQQTSAPLVPGQRLPNAAAGRGQFCTVVRSGETVPFRLNPRGGTPLSSQDCSALGQVLDSFIPTYLRTFVTRDASLAGFNRDGDTARSGSPAQDPFGPLPGDNVLGNRDGNLNTGARRAGNGIFDSPARATNNDRTNGLFNTNVNRDLGTSNNINNLNVVDGFNGNSVNSNQRAINGNFVGNNGLDNRFVDNNDNNINDLINRLSGSNNLSDFISVRQDITGCSVLVPNIVPQC